MGNSYLPMGRTTGVTQGCALAEPGGPWRLTFALRRLANLRFFIQIIRWAPWILQFQSTGLPSIFLRAQPWWLYAIINLLVKKRQLKCTCIMLFGWFHYHHCMTTTWNCLILFTFCGQRKQMKMNFFSFLNLEGVLRNSTTGEFA